MNIGTEIDTEVSEHDPYDPATQLWAMLLLISSDSLNVFRKLSPEAQDALIALAYEKSFEALHNRRA